MSGIAALIRLDGGDADARTVAAMTAAMAYRGPDGIAHWADGAAALGHCTMHASTADEPRQPLANADGQVVAVFDGFLANRVELADELGRPAAASDIELVLAAHERWGAEFAARLDGEFALLVWDGRQRSAIAARDHHGLRPLYWHWDGRVLAVASEIAALLAALPQPPAANPGYLAEVAANTFFSADETVWQGINRLLPAHTLHFDGSAPRLREYWTLPTVVDIIYRREEEYAEHYRELLTQCVLRAARSHRPLACEVSGGLDSSSIYCLAQRMHMLRALPAPGLHGYTLAGPEGSAADEIGFARMVGAHTGTAIAEHPLFLPPLDWFARRATEDRDMPPLPNAAMSIMLDEAAVADGCRVSLSGIGGDQWCDGTHFYYGELLAARQWAQLLGSYRADIAAGGFFAATRLFARLGPGSLLPPAWRKRLREATSGGAQADEPYYLVPAMQRELTERRARYESGFDADYRASYKLRKLRSPIWSVILDQLSRQRARTGLELRSPMMSRRFIEFSARTPEHLKLHGGISKTLHRHALTGILPASVAQRQSKAEFSTAYAGLVPALESELESGASRPGHVTDTLFEAGEISKLFGIYYDTPIDERSHREIWGAYVAMLMVKQPDENSWKGSTR